MDPNLLDSVNPISLRTSGNSSGINSSVFAFSASVSSEKLLHDERIKKPRYAQYSFFSHSGMFPTAVVPKRTNRLVEERRKRARRIVVFLRRHHSDVSIWLWRIWGTLLMLVIEGIHRHTPGPRRIHLYPQRYHL